MGVGGAGDDGAGGAGGTSGAGVGVHPHQVGLVQPKVWCKRALSPEEEEGR